LCLGLGLLCLGLGLAELFVGSQVALAVLVVPEHPFTFIAPIVMAFFADADAQFWHPDGIADHLHILALNQFVDFEARFALAAGVVDNIVEDTKLLVEVFFGAVFGAIFFGYDFDHELGDDLFFPKDVAETEIFAFNPLNADGEKAIRNDRGFIRTVVNPHIHPKEPILAIGPDHHKEIFQKVRNKFLEFAIHRRIVAIGQVFGSREPIKRFEVFQHGEARSRSQLLYCNFSRCNLNTSEDGISATG
jgi:hypothetical protein